MRNYTHAPFDDRDRNGGTWWWKLSLIRHGLFIGLGRGCSLCVVLYSTFAVWLVVFDKTSMSPELSVPLIFIIELQLKFECKGSWKCQPPCFWLNHHAYHKDHCAHVSFSALEGMWGGATIWNIWKLSSNCTHDMETELILAIFIMIYRVGNVIKARYK